MSSIERTFVKACAGYDDNYLFISYAHVDRIKVERVLNILYRRGFRIWYDQNGSGIPAGEEWYPTIMKRIEKSSSFLAFISNATEHREIVLEEIKKALKKKKKDPEYQVIFVFLERVSAEGFPREIRENLRECQFIDFKKRGGITEEFVEAICNVHWPVSIVDQQYRADHGLEPWAPDTDENVRIQDSISWFDSDSSLFSQDGQFVMTDTDSGSIGFYAVSPDQLDPNIVYPTVMDNQWVPEELYSSELFYVQGVRGKDIAPIITAKQRQEILRSLIHNRQIIVNRASILNSKVFSDWYDPGNSEYDDFIGLLDKAAVMLFLFTETGPVDYPKKFNIPEENKRAWMNVCRSVKVRCLRFDWESEESNSYETALIGYAFKNFCLSLADDEYTMGYLERALRIPPSDKSGRDRSGFLDVWRKVQKDVFDYRSEENKIGNKGVYIRERFYKSFLIAPEKKVADGILDKSKNPFVKELKRIIDFYYSINLPFALGAQPLPPSDTPLSLNMFLSENSIRHLREIESDELTYSVTEFKAIFDPVTVRLPENLSFSLGDVVRLRELREWRDYMRTVTEGKKRASLDQLDFYDTKKVRDRHTAFLSAAEKLLPDKDWTDRPAAISIIYCFDSVEVTTVYTHDRVRFRITTPENDAKSVLNRKSRLCVNYICCDALTSDKNNLLVTELRLFEGVTHDMGSVAYSALMNKFKELGFVEYEGKL